MARSRLCKKLKWVGLSITLFLIGIECLSLFWVIGYYFTKGSFGIGPGHVHAAYGGLAADVARLAGTGMYVKRIPHTISYIWEAPLIQTSSWVTPNTPGGTIMIALWVLILIAALPTAFLWWYDRQPLLSTDIPNEKGKAEA